MANVGAFQSHLYSHTDGLRAALALTNKHNTFSVTCRMMPLFSSLTLSHDELSVWLVDPLERVLAWAAVAPGALTE